ncbi:probable disease resistance protein At4g27220 [Medicago truncatula]|nr:probable disease resistance protein At4g27220 [Medicago truncatula]
MEFLTELSKEAVSKLGELAVQSTVKQFEYVIQHKQIIADLKEEHNKLKGVKEALQAWVDTKRMNREGTEPNIEKWLNDVAAFENVLQSFYEEKVKMNKKCFGGKCPNLTYNYSLGKQASKSIEYIIRLKEEKNEFQLISYHKAPPTLGSTFTEDIKSLESRKIIIKGVIEKLKDDKFKRISICGMGGVGKTTLVKEIIKSVENKLFDKVVMAVISQNPDYKYIQSQIADCLGLSLKSESVDGRGRELIHRLKEIDDDGKIKVLVVLDDVWSELNFDWVGLPSRDNQKCSKIIFTSRNEKECQKMGSQVNFHVSILLKDEAWYLFQSMAGDVVYEPRIYPIAKQVAKECGGLPLAIVIVGKALENEKKLSAWEDAFEQLQNSQSSSFSDVHNFVYSRIELSFKFWGSTEHKKFLMLCGLFPEDFDIPIESLLCHAMGLGLFKAIGEPWKARNRVNSFVDDLKRCFLLLDSNVPGCVKIHDIVRDVVILVAFKIEHGFMVRYDMKSLKEEKLNDISALSLILNETVGLEDNLECPTLQLLQVRSKEKKPNHWPEHFFQCMKSLKVLSMQNVYIPKLPSLSQVSVSLHMLLLEYCDVGDISIIGKELIHLEVLSFAHSKIKELPVEIGNLSILRLLDLTNCNDLKVISTNVLIRLSRLEELYLRMDNFPWEKNEIAINELKKISHQLKVVEMKVRGTEISVKDLNLYNLQKFWIYVDLYSDFQRSAYLESNLLQVGAIDYQSINSILMVSQLIKKCEILAIRKVKSLKNVMPQMSPDCPIPYLKDLRVDSCPDLQHLIDCSVRCNDFPQIHSLSLKKLQNLKEMCYTHNNHEVKGMIIDFSYFVKLELIDLPNLFGFNNAMDLKELNQVKRISCDKSELTRVEEGVLSMSGKLFSSDWMQHFPKLETILLQNCSSINVVFDTERYLDGQVFPQLKELEISHLNQLTHVWSKAMHCVQGFQNLKTLTISNCDSLRQVFTPAIIGAITNIEELEIQSCKLMEYLVTDDEDGDEGDHINKEEVNIISFEKLDSLTLSRLPSIAHVSANSYKIEFPSLRKLVIDDCPKLDTLLLLCAYTKHTNHSTASYLNLDGTGVSHFEENNPRSSNFHSGCTPLCSKLIRQSKKNNKINKAPSVSETKLEIELGGAPLLEDLYVNYCGLQGMDKTRIRSAPVIDGHLFPYLKSLIMESCNKISVLLSFSSMRYLERLEKLHVLNCRNLNEIVSQEESESSEEKIVFPALQDLLLENLPNLKAFFKGPCNLDFPSLQKVDITDCPNMELFSRGLCSAQNLEDINICQNELCITSYINKNDMNATIQRSKACVELKSSEMLNWKELIDKDMFGYFSKEGAIYIREFRRLSMLVPFSEIQMLQHVRILGVGDCDSLVEVFESEGEFTKRGVATHYHLQKMTLEYLPRLSRIWKHNITEFVSFQNLTEIEVSDCRNLRSLLSHSMARSLVQLQKIVVVRCGIMEEIITIEGESIEGGNKVKTLFP